MEQEVPQLTPGDMVVVELDPDLYDCFIPPAVREAQDHRGRKARGAQARGAAKESVTLVWRVAQIKQVLPATPTDEMSLHVHLYDSHEPRTRLHH